MRTLLREAVAAMAFRRRSMAIADEVGQRLVDLYPPRWSGRWSLEKVTLSVSANGTTDTVRCDVRPWPVKRTASSQRLAIAVARLGGSLDEGIDDGLITFRLYPQEYLAPPGEE